MKKILSILILGLVFVAQSHAETVYLKDGRVIKGKILNRGGEEITIRAEGGTLEHYFDEQILRIGPEDEPAVFKTEEENSPLANISGEKVELIMEFVDVSGIGYSIQENIEKILAQAPAQKQAELKTIFNFDKIVLEMVPVYNKYYSEQELKEIIAFYKTPTGKKVIEVTPKILNEFMQITVDALKKSSQP